MDGMPDPALLRAIPPVEALVAANAGREEFAGLSRERLTGLVRETVEGVRREARTGSLAPGGEGGEGWAAWVRREIAARLLGRARESARAHYRRAINATGVILHTGLGRAVLAEEALAQVGAELRGYSVLQQSVETGERTRRDLGVERLLCLLTGAEAATVVNNNAAATMLALAAMAAGREVLVSRGQLIEIGGSFRLPDVMAASGAKLVEVGTTNKTHPRDYANALTERTAAIMRVHPSNYRIHGFVREVGTAELVAIAKPRGIPVIDDLGAGALLDLSRFGFEKEPTIQESVRAGADVVLSSADKLIGGPQGGIILGRAAVVAAIRKHPLARIVRVDKVTLAALEATLRLFLDEGLALRRVPTLRMLCRTVEEIGAEAAAMADWLRAEGGGALPAEVALEDGASFMGGGSLPEQELPTRLVAVRPRAMGAAELAARLRRGVPAVFCRVRHEGALFDPRTMLAGEAAEAARAVARCLVEAPGAESAAAA